MLRKIEIDLILTVQKKKLEVVIYKALYCSPVFPSMFLSQNIFPIPKQLAFSVIIDDRKGPRVRFLLQWWCVSSPGA